MTPKQREAAERLIAEHPTLFMNDLPDWCDDAFHLLRELAEVPVQETMQKKPSTASQFESVKEAKKVAEAQLSYYRKMMADKSTEPVVNQQMTTEPVQEPIARLHDDGHFSWQSYEARRQFDSKHEYEGWAMDVYAAPQQRTPLSDEVVAKLINDEWATPDVPSAWKFARAIERAHGITGEPT